MKIAFLPGELECTGKYFGSLPAELLAAKGHDAHCDITRLPDVSLVTSRSGPIPSDPALRDRDLIVLIRPPCIGLRAFVHAVKAQGTIVVHCVDDWLFGEGRRAGLYGGEAGFREVLATYKYADGFICSTPRLAENFAVFGKPIWVQRIGLWRDHYRDLPSRQRAQTVTIGWTGVGWIRPYDLKPLGGVIRQVLDRHAHVRFLAVGDHHTLDILGLASHPRAEHIDLVPLEEYPRQVARLDVGLAPLAETEVNRCKTAIKVLEYLAAGVVPIAAAWQPEYATVINDGINGFLVDRPSEWRVALDKLVSDQKLRTTMGASAVAAAQQHFIDADTGRYVRLYEEVLSTLRCASKAAS
jgi:glycosyltransferase involved in cell wall biosynthesis